MQQLLDFEGNVQETFGQSFTADYSVMGKVITYELIPNGSEVPLTNENREKFVTAYVDFVLNKSVDVAFSNFKQGYDSVCGGTAIALFNPREVRLLVCGSLDLDFEALRVNTSYDGGFTAEHTLMQHFWEIVLAFDDAQKKLLLQFATGSDRVPISGLGKLNFTITKNGPDSERLPSSHTCFNVLLMPEYTSRQRLHDKLLTAMQNSEGFGMI